MFALKRIKITNFKPFTSYMGDFGKGINIIYGENATGKTSLVEAIANLILTKNFKGIKDGNLVNNGSNFYSLVGEFDVDGEKTIITTSYYNNKKTIKENDHLYKRALDYIGKYVVVVFEPGDLELITGSPKVKRRFLDLNISQLNRVYIENITKYNKLIKTRNEFLRLLDEQGQDESYLDVLDEKILKCGKYVIKARKEFLKNINSHAKKLSSIISCEVETTKIKYNPSASEDEYEEKYKSSREADKITKTTSVGPHRDTFDVFVNEKDATVFSSRGQIRTAAVAMKIACGHHFMSLEKKIIFIMDDLFGELDTKRQEELIKTLSKNDQIFITTTSLEGISKEILENVTKIELKRRRKWTKNQIEKKNMLLRIFKS